MEKWETTVHAYTFFSFCLFFVLTGFNFGYNKTAMKVCGDVSDFHLNVLSSITSHNPMCQSLWRQLKNIKKLRWNGQSRWTRIELSLKSSFNLFGKVLHIKLIDQGSMNTVFWMWTAKIHRCWTWTLEQWSGLLTYGMYLFTKQD